MQIGDASADVDVERVGDSLSFKTKLGPWRIGFKVSFAEVRNFIAVCEGAMKDDAIPCDGDGDPGPWGDD